MFYISISVLILYMMMASATAVRMRQLEHDANDQGTAFYVFYGLLWPLVVLGSFFDSEWKKP